MNKEEIYELMDRFQSSDIFSMEVECEEFSLKLQKTPPAPPAPAMPPMMAPMMAAPAPASGAAPAAAAAAPSADDSSDGTEVITSPLVGTFYAAPSPGSEPYVMPGSHVKAGDTLCLVEAMKTMNEISAPCDCQIVSVLADDATLVSFGEELIRYVKE